MNRRQREAGLERLVRETGYWDWQPRPPWRLRLIVQEGSPNAWISSASHPIRKRKGEIAVCVTVPKEWGRLVRAEGCAVVDGLFVLQAEWLKETPEVDAVATCTVARLLPSKYHEAGRMVVLAEGFLAGHGGAFTYADTLVGAVLGVVEKWERAIGIGPDRENQQDQLPF